MDILISPDLVVIIGAALIGLILGSFASMASYRLPRRLGWGGRSFCDGCGIALGVRDLVPVATWVVRGGHCRCRQEPVSPRYPLIELGMGVACGLAAWRFGPGYALVALMVLATVLAIGAIVDTERRFKNTSPLSRVPYGLIFGLVVYGAILVAGP